MSSLDEPRRRTDLALMGGGVLMVLCCAVGPAVIGAVAGSAIGGWLGIVCAVILAAAVGLLLHRRARRLPRLGMRTMESGLQFPLAGPASCDATRGVGGGGKCSEHHIWRRSDERQCVGMAAQRPPIPDAARFVDTPPAAPGVLLTAADFEVLVRELDRLRNRHRAEFARNLRDARTYGSAGENDDVLTVFEEAVVDEARIAQLEEVVRTASVVDEDLVFDGRAGLGCAVRVVDNRGRTNEYILVGRRLQGSPADHVSLASPVGKALAGTSAGDAVRVVLPGGRDRELRVVEVTSPRTDGLPDTAKAA